jgi:Ca2+-binding RTX toxin-like protein
MALIGTAGADTLSGTAGPDEISGLEGDDLFIGVGGGGGDTVDGGAGIDTLSFAGAGGPVTVGLYDVVRQDPDRLQNIEVVVGSRFDDRLMDGEGAETIYGGDGADTITAKSSSLLMGEGGDDSISARGTSASIVDGGEGNDTISHDIQATTYGRAGNDSIVIGGGLASGGDGDDTLSAVSGTGSSTLEGDAGSDLLLGGAGAETIRAGAGADTIVGGGGRDDLAGGDGADVFMLRRGDSLAGPGFVDVIRDWGRDDTLAFRGRYVGAGYAEATAGTFFEAIVRARDHIQGGSVNYVAVAVGSDVYVFADTADDDGQGDDVALLSGRTLADIDVSNVEGAAVGPGASGFISGDMDTLRLSRLSGAAIDDSTATELVLIAANADAALLGTGLTYDAAGQLVGGTVSEVRLRVTETSPFSFFQASLTVPNVPAGLFAGWIAADATQQALAFILAGPDTLEGGTQADRIHGYDGDDVIFGGGGSDRLLGGAGNDTLYAAGRTGEGFGQLSAQGEAGDDTLAGGLGPDTLNGGDGLDRLMGEGGNDVLDGGGGRDFMRGGDGADSLSGGAEFDDMHGNMGADTAAGGEGDDWVVGGKDNDVLFGDAGGDLVYGNLGDDTCDGGGGADILRGGQANDILLAGAGDDFVSGDRGDDTVAGGAGADIFHGSQDAGLDLVLDFSLAEGDRVQLDPGTTYTLRQSGADTVIDMGGGHQMVLVGVQLTSLPAGWIFGA